MNMCTFPYIIVGYKHTNTTYCQVRQLLLLLFFFLKMHFICYWPHYILTTCPLKYFAKLAVQVKNMAESGSTDLPKCHFCCTCKEVIGVSKEGHEDHDIQEKEQAKKYYEDELTTKLNEEEFVDSLLDVESELRCLELLDHHKTKIEYSHDDGLLCYRASKAISQIFFNSLPFIYDKRQFKNKDAGNIRIASWNLTDFSSEFMTVPNKIEIVCETIVHHQFDIVALQEVGETKKVIKTPDAAIHTLLTELCKKDDSWKLEITTKSIGQIKQGIRVHGVFLYKSNISCTVRRSRGRPATLGSQKFGREPVVREIDTGEDLKFSLINFHLSTRYNRQSKKRNSQQLRIIHTKIASSRKDQILLGDFNNYVKESTAIKLYEKGYRNLFGEGETTTTSTKYRSCLDAIIVHRDFELRCTQHGVAGIVLKGDITPEDISTHKPIWADFKKK